MLETPAPLTYMHTASTQSASLRHGSSWAPFEQR
jgi:hypothetical protein